MVVFFIASSRQHTFKIKGRPDEAAFVNNWFLLMRKL